MSGHRIAALAPEHARALVQLFERSGSPCYCRYWHFQGDKNAWLDRCANHPADNARELESAVNAREAHGVVALAPDGRVLGYMKIAPAGSMRKLYDQRLYRSLPCFDGDRSGVWTVGCFLVDEAARRGGIASDLLAAGLELAREAKATAVEAFPRRGSDLAPEEQWTGPGHVFERHGFREVHSFQPYPVLRCEL